MSLIYKLFIGLFVAILVTTSVEAQTSGTKAKTTTPARKPYSPAPKPVVKSTTTKPVTKPAPDSTKAATTTNTSATATPASTTPPAAQTPAAVKSSDASNTPVSTPSKSAPTATTQTIRPAKSAISSSRGSSFGLRVGGNYASVTPKNTYLEGLGASGAKLDFSPGFDVAAALNLSLGNVLSFQPEVQFSQWGLKASVEEEFISTRTNYLMVPLSLRLSVGDQIRFFIQGGGFGYYVLSSQVKIKAGGVEQSGTVNFENAEFTERSGYGAGGGAGVILPVGKSNLVLEGRYQHVLGTFDGTKAEVHPTAISFTVGYFLPL